jgi:hypothetical protein
MIDLPQLEVVSGDLGISEGAGPDGPRVAGGLQSRGIPGRMRRTDGGSETLADSRRTGSSHPPRTEWMAASQTVGPETPSRPHPCRDGSGRNGSGGQDDDPVERVGPWT